MTRDSHTPGRGRFAWRLPKHWSLRVKFSVVLLVPLVLALALGAIRISDQMAQAGERDRVARVIAVQGVVSTLLTDVEMERYRAAEYVANGRRDDRALRGAMESVDQRATQAASALSDLPGDDASNLAGLGLVREQAEQALARMASLRDVVTRSGATAPDVLGRYSDLLGQLVQLDSALLRSVNTAEVLGLANSLAALDAAREEATLQQAQMTIATAGPLTPEMAAGLQFSGARLDTELTNFRVALNAAQRVRYAGIVAGPANSERESLMQAVLTGSAADDAAARVDTVYGGLLGSIDATAEGVRSELTATASDRRQNAVIAAWLNVAALLAALALGALIVGMVARAMISSLGTLRRSAETVAKQHLPEAVQQMRRGEVPDVNNVNPVPVTTQEEVGQVARAFDAVHKQAVSLAAEQAVLQANMNSMYMNVSRRSQVLVDRQLDLIGQLEAGENDPEQLEDLTRLNHLAARMRRNSENLLVLSGSPVERVDEEPRSVRDTLRAAAAEIEQYQRVVVRSFPDATFVGEAAQDIQHLLAELLDNAARHSPPDSQVVLTSSRARDDSVLIEIFDKGSGLSAGQLAALNDRLHNPGEASAAAARQMGLFVVGRLARRHGIWVGLFTDKLGTGADTEALSEGVTARVTIPAGLVGEPVEEPEPVLWSRVDAVKAAARLPRQARGGERPLLPQRHPPGPSGDDTVRMPVVPGDGRQALPAEPAREPVRVAVPPAPAPNALFDPVVPPPELPALDAPRPPDPFAVAEPPRYDVGATPIFEEVTSGWFHTAEVQEWSPPPTTAEIPAIAALVPAGAGVDQPDPLTFATTADSGWRAALAMDAAPEAADLTDAGLPRRVPRGRLVPGNAGPAAPQAPRDADAVRGRLTGFQRGVRDGRGRTRDEHEKD